MNTASTFADGAIRTHLVATPACEEAESLQEALSGEQSMFVDL